MIADAFGRAPPSASASSMACSRIHFQAATLNRTVVITRGNRAGSMGCVWLNIRPPF